VRTVIYARYSSQLQNARSIEDQVAICRERADREGWPIEAVFSDRAISGAAGIEEGQRPGLTALLARVEAGGVDQVLAESTDRIARHQGDAFAVRELLDFAGVRLFTLMDGVVDDITGTIKGLMDARFRKDLGARIKRGQRGMVEQGRAPAGIAYGYRSANCLDERREIIRGLREIDPDQAEIVRRIFAEYLAGVSPQRIALGLNRDGVPGPRGRGWTESTIRGDRKRLNGMLNNRLYAGELVLGRTSKIVQPRTRKTVIRPNAGSEWMTRPAPALRIVDAAMWEAVQQRLEETRGMPIHAQRRPKHMLSGLGHCGVCGGGYIRIGRDFWGCSNTKNGRGCTNTRTIGTPSYEARVIAHLQRDLLDPEIAAAYVREYHRAHARRMGDLTRGRAALERKVDEATRKVERLVAAIAAGVGEFEEIRDALATARADRDARKAELARIGAIDVMTLHPNAAARYQSLIAELAEALNGDAATQLEAIPRFRELIERITITPADSLRGVDIVVTERMEMILNLAIGPQFREEQPRVARTG